MIYGAFNESRKITKRKTCCVTGVIGKQKDERRKTESLVVLHALLSLHCGGGGAVHASRYDHQVEEEKSEWRRKKGFHMF